jgi:hypothetical protein
MMSIKRDEALESGSKDGRSGCGRFLESRIQSIINRR